MRRGLKYACLVAGALVALSLAALLVLNWQEATRRDRPIEGAQLSVIEKSRLTEALRLQRTLGDQVWPGLGEAAIPIIMFNDRYEFLTGPIEPPAPWIAVNGDDFRGEPYYRRVADRPQAFAVAVGSQWAGSIPTLDRMNREYLLGVRQQLPPGLAQLFPYPWATISPDLYQATILHELFHAHQATLAPDRMARATGAYAVERLYPYGDPEFAAAWDREGSILAGALKASDDGSASELARQFLQARKERRVGAGLTEELLAYERELEWLEGLAKYAEIRFYELAATQRRGSELVTYSPGLPYWQMEFGRLENQLGRQGGDFRFYLGGMAMARVMDRLSPNWKEQALQGNLEDALRTAIGQD